MPDARDARPRVRLDRAGAVHDRAASGGTAATGARTRGKPGAISTQGWLGPVGTFMFTSPGALRRDGPRTVLGQSLVDRGSAGLRGARASLFAFISPRLLTGQHGLRDLYPPSRRACLEQRRGAAPTRVTVQDVSEFTNAPNAVTATGLVRRGGIVVWDIASARIGALHRSCGVWRRARARERLTRRAPRTSFGKSVGWFALLGFPAPTPASSLATRRRGGMANAGGGAALALRPGCAQPARPAAKQNIVTRVTWRRRRTGRFCGRRPRPGGAAISLPGVRADLAPRIPDPGARSTTSQSPRTIRRSRSASAMRIEDRR